MSIDWNKEHPQFSAYDDRFPTPAEALESRTDAFKLLADYGLAEMAYQRISTVQESIFAEHLQRGEPIADWAAFAEEVLRRANVPPFAVE